MDRLLGANLERSTNAGARCAWNGGPLRKTKEILEKYFTSFSTWNSMCIFLPEWSFPVRVQCLRPSYDETGHKCRAGTSSANNYRDRVLVLDKLFRTPRVSRRTTFLIADVCSFTVERTKTTTIRLYFGRAEQCAPHTLLILIITDMNMSSAMRISEIMLMILEEPLQCGTDANVPMRNPNSCLWHLRSARRTESQPGMMNCTGPEFFLKQFSALWHEIILFWIALPSISKHFALNVKLCIRDCKEVVGVQSKWLQGFVLWREITRNMCLMFLAETFIAPADIALIW